MFGVSTGLGRKCHPKPPCRAIGCNEQCDSELATPLWLRWSVRFGERHGGTRRAFETHLVSRYTSKTNPQPSRHHEPILGPVVQPCPRCAPGHPIGYSFHSVPPGTCVNLRAGPARR